MQHNQRQYGSVWSKRRRKHIDNILNAKSKNTLTPQDWLQAGFRALTIGGPQAIRAEAIARELKVSKGSFYWHFKNIPAYKAAMLQHWRDQATDAIVAAVDAKGGSPQDRLRLLVRISASHNDDAYGGFLAEAAIRDWGRYDPLAQETVKAVDTRRMAYLNDLFMGCGFDGEPSHTRSSLLYGALIGLLALADNGFAKPEPDMEHLLEMLLR